MRLNYKINKRLLQLWLIDELSTKEIAKRLGKTRIWVRATKQRLKYKNLEKIYGIKAEEGKIWKKTKV